MTIRWLFKMIGSHRLETSASGGQMMRLTGVSQLAAFSQYFLQAVTES
jgi:hypothetical protein